MEMIWIKVSPVENNGRSISTSLKLFMLILLSSVIIVNGQLIKPKFNQTISGMELEDKHNISNRIDYTK